MTDILQDREAALPRLTDRIGSAVACEILARASAPVPMPCELEAERVVAAALLVGMRPESCDLRGEHFWSRLLGAVFEIGSLLRSHGMTVSAESLVVALREQDWRGPVEVEILRLRDEVPAVSRSQLEECAAMVCELAERRRLIRLCCDVEAQLRAGACDAADAVLALAEGVGSAT